MWKHTFTTILALAIGFASANFLWGQEAKVSAQVQPNVLTRGPIHEAFAQPVTADIRSGVVVKTEPPALIHETPALLRPVGQNEHWISGYWDVDPLSQSFEWVSGIWRAAPEGRRWVSGFWTKVPNGWTRVAGHWAASQEANFQFIPTPPADQVENARIGVMANADSFLIPGSWFYDRGGFQWRRGYEAEFQEGKVWVPTHIGWTPYGYIFNSGYWDLPLTQRGLLFAPVRFQGDLANAANINFRPEHMVTEIALNGNLSIRADSRAYFFGDFAEKASVDAGIEPLYKYAQNHADALFQDAAHKTGNIDTYVNKLANEFEGRVSGKTQHLATNLEGQANADVNATTQATVTLTAGGLQVQAVNEAQVAAEADAAAQTMGQVQATTLATANFATTGLVQTNGMLPGLVVPGLNVPSANVSLPGLMRVPSAILNSPGPNSPRVGFLGSNVVNPGFNEFGNGNLGFAQGGFIAPMFSPHFGGGGVGVGAIGGIGSLVRIR